MARILPETATGFLTELNLRFPEPRPTSGQSHEDYIWQSAQRAVYLQMNDAYVQARKRG